MENPERAKQGEDGPPTVPDIDRRIHLYRLQVVGLTVLAVLPLLAILGLFDQRLDVEVRATPALEVEAEHPTRIRTTREASIRVEVRNRSGEPLDGVYIKLPDDHLGGFGVTGLLPAVSAIGRIDLPPLEPGESRVVRIGLKAERIGWHRDTIRVVSAAGDDLSIPLRTFILP
jgi:hypothetical protein